MSTTSHKHDLEVSPTTPMEEKPPADDHKAYSGSQSSISDAGHPETNQVNKTTPPKPQNSEDEESGGRSRGKIALIMLALCLAVFLAAIDVTIITTALPTIAEHFHSSAGYTWIGSAYILGAAASTPIWGKTSDIFGRKPALLVANAIFFVGSLIAALSVSIGMLITARAIQGVGGGGLITLVNICIGDLFSQRRRGAYYGMIGGTWAVALSLGPIIGGAFSEDVTWRWCFYINLPIDGVAFAIILFFLDVKNPKTPFWDGVKAIDWLGSLFIVGGTLMFLFGLQYGGDTYPWDSAIVICLLIFGVFTICVFFLVEWKLAKYPVMPLRLFSNRTAAGSLGVCFIHGFVFIAGSYYLPLYFQAVLGATPILSGVYILASSGALSVSSIATGIFIRKTGQYIPPIYFGLIMMTIGYGLYIDLDANSSWAKIILYQIVAGLGTGPLFQAPLISIQSAVSPRDIGSVTSTFGFTRNLATATSIVVGQVVFQNEMKGKAQQLAQALGPKVAERLGGGNAGANVQLIQSLPQAAQNVADNAFADSLSTMWIVYTAFAAVGIGLAVLIKRKELSKSHKETETGLEAEEKNRLEHKQEAADASAAKKAAKREKAAGKAAATSSGDADRDIEKADS